MHELYVTRSIFRIVLRHATRHNVQCVRAVRLEIGALSDLESEWIQRYFDKLSRGTVVEGARLDIERIPAVFLCRKCSANFKVHDRAIKAFACPECRGREIQLISGREFRIRNMEAL